MKVKKLIEQLSKLDGELPVVIPNEYAPSHTEVDELEIGELTPKPHGRYDMYYPSEKIKVVILS